MHPTSAGQRPALRILARQAGKAQVLLLLSLLVSALVAVPILGVLSNLFNGSAGLETFTHLAATVLPEYLANSVLIAASVATLGGFLGVTCAWLVAVHTFPGRGILAWALVLPLAMPGYVVAYAYTDFLQYAGPLQTALRNWFGWSSPQAYWFPQIRSVGGAGLVFALVLYPYVYLLARNAFLERSPRMLDAARTLGAGPWRVFFSISLPLARPAAAAGIALALMETLADYGAVAYFGVPTLTTGIYKSWYAFSDRAAAAQLAAILLLTICSLLWLERKSRGRARYYAVASRTQAQTPIALPGWRGVAASAFCCLPVLAGFVLPVCILLRLLWQESGMQLDARYLEWVANSVLLALGTAVLAALLCLLLAYAARVGRGRWQGFANQVVELGYAVPGAVIAVGVLIPLSRLDNWFSAQGIGIMLGGSVLALVYAYLVRFLAVAYQSVQAGLCKITPAMDASARSLGLGLFAMLRRVHAPLLWRSVLTAALLVFVDVIKELPTTLTVRPFNFDTLAVIAHQLAADERLGEAALPALTIVVIALVPVLMMARAIAKGEK